MGDGEKKVKWNDSTSLWNSRLEYNYINFCFYVLFMKCKTVKLLNCVPSYILVLNGKGPYMPERGS